MIKKILKTVSQITTYLRNINWREILKTIVLILTLITLSVGLLDHFGVMAYLLADELTKP